MKKLFFLKKFRLLSYYDFKNVFDNSLKFKMSEMIILYHINNFSYPRLGIIVSKKVSKLSYMRNFIKRLVREKFRLVQHFLLNYDFIVIIKFNFLKLNRNDMHMILKKMWMRYYK